MYTPSNKEEQKYLEEYDANKYKKPCVTVDLIAWCRKDDGLLSRVPFVLVVKRKNFPYKGCWAIPGGFLDVGKETTEHAAIRELKEETNITARRPVLLNVYSDPNRDPRDHVVSAVYTFCTTEEALSKRLAADDAAEVALARVYEDGTIKIGKHKYKNLAFDHQKILADFYERIEG